MRAALTGSHPSIQKGKDIVHDWVWDIPDGDEALKFCMAMTPCETTRRMYMDMIDSCPRRSPYLLYLHDLDVGTARASEAPLSHTKDRNYYGPQLLASAQKEWPDRLEGQSEEDFLESLCSDSIRRHQVSH